ncbi:DUF6156 family protein [Bradyrhizobium sp. STM 3809]|uniref:DUF6156 family protein n=1 Tax=Bradyrhizobium sp. STM 3809 TaxID=551936 RepID=UPI000240929D|nr:DUF6156 family protein [Bradyrhizobium sp. STM 3809]CCE00765.1 conserved hypothetical protein [Bradyrhizobium sp. STM 3809]
MTGTGQDCQFFVSYTGVKLPLRLVTPIAPEQLSNRNTFIRGYFNAAGALTGFEKVVYGEIELTHRYNYHANGALRSAEIVMLDEDPVTLHFDETGAAVAGQDAA